MSNHVQETDSKRVVSISVYKPKLSFRGDVIQSSSLTTKSKQTSKFQLRGFHILFGILYIALTTWMISTIGHPYKLFLERADRDGFTIMEGLAKHRAEFTYAFSDLNDPDRPTEKIGWFDWMDADIEDLHERKKREREQSVLDSLPKSWRVPPKFQPGFWSMLVSGLVGICNALVVLLQHWSVGFDVWLNYTSCTSEQLVVDEEDDTPTTGAPTHARVSPLKGKDVLVPILYRPTLGATVTYHRRQYVYNPQSQTWCKIRCRTDMPLPFFSTWVGHALSTLLPAEIRFGPNIFDVVQPTFLELYKLQLLSPFTVFQVFCAILWMLDEYWQYSMFTLVMILIFEATVVFSRIKSLSALRGMGNPNRRVMVYRNQIWMMVDSHELLPGDVFSLTRKIAKKNAVPKPGQPKVDEQGDVVVADCLLLRGATVVNEASLTGESVPQMKEGLVELEEGVSLQMKTRHKSNVLYAGTKLLQCKGTAPSSDEEGVEHLIPSPPDGGCICFVLRTGFSSAQGKLVRMIEGSQEKVKGHERDTGLLLLLLLVFAVMSSGYVLKKGFENDNRSKYELLLHCILIITSVIPPELPMQMALAVNNSLMTLMKMNVFCTEPFRVPIAGKLDSCLFDKTGTLTTDELVAVGVVQNKSLKLMVDLVQESLGNGGIKGKKKKIEKKEGTNDSNLTPMTQVLNESGLVLAACHSLVVVDDETLGDPLESASLSAMRWNVTTTTHGPSRQTRERIVPMPSTEKRTGGQALMIDSLPVTKLEILTRHHFSSKLQRMSCVVNDVDNRRVFAVVKGSPEAIGERLTTKPPGYDAVSRQLAKEGYRVIALAFKTVSARGSELASLTRADLECRLQFCGFVAFTCRIRKDTKMVLNQLKEGGMKIAMITGDAILTAAHVAKKVGICDADEYDAEEEENKILGIVETNEELRNLLLEKKSRKKSELERQRGLGLGLVGTQSGVADKKPLLMLEQHPTDNTMYWQSYHDDSMVETFVAETVPELSKRYDLATTGKNLANAFEYDAGTKKVLWYFKIFARMTPDAKETVIECLHSVGHICLMCGDGANDVGALKQADVGVALLSGFGDLNVDKGEDGNKKKKEAEEKQKKLGSLNPTAIVPRNELEALKVMPVMFIKARIKALGVNPDKYPDLTEKEDLIELYRIKATEVAIAKHEQKNKVAKTKLTKVELQVKKKQGIADQQKKMMERIAELEAQGVKWAQFVAMKEMMSNQTAEGRKRKAEMQKRGSIEGSASAMAAQLEDMETDELPMVKLGDASIAAPFTSKMPSIRSCVDIIRQGRCTLVTSIQMYQILALNCLISAYSLSVLYLDGVKYGDTQMTAMGMLGSVSFMSVSRSKPLNKLSSVRPLTSIFHPSLFISLLGQFTVHLVTMMVAVKAAKDHLPEGYEADLDGRFQPGILNSVVFLVTNVQQVTVFVVNLQGRPFMNGLTENRPLLWSLAATFILTFMFASESLPGLNKYFQLVPFPSDDFRDFILKILAADVFLTFMLDRLMKFIFCREILVASLEGTTMKDVFSLVKTFVVIGGIMYALLGNDEQWEEMLREEGRLEGEDMLLNETNVNGTNITELALDAVLNVAGAVCTGIGCDTGEGIMHESEL
mmetsp:Transcript_26285/g.30249  ORF Transcript_26285/g.30249 Transcript_26285/m.30249 type:complete len:1611 (-) Transcript_26285:174-5006(-)